MKLNEIQANGKSVADLGMKYKGGDFDCSNNDLTSLEGSPQKVGGRFDCYDNKLTSLKGAPLEVGGNFDCRYNKLTSLEGASQEVGGDFYCGDNDLTSLEGGPQKVGGSFNCNYNKNLTSLKGIHKLIKQIDGSYFEAAKCPIQSHVLGLLLIKGLKIVALDNKKVQYIINAHLDGGSMRSAMDCQHELIKAGFPEYAQL